MIKKAVTCFLSTPAFFPRVCSCKASAWRKEIVIYTQIFPFLNPYLPDFLTPKISKNLPTVVHPHQPTTKKYSHLRLIF